MTMQGKVKKPWRGTIQTVKGLCTCKAEYPGTARSLVLKTEGTAPLSWTSQWAHNILELPRPMHFDECVANVYDRQTDQHIPAHTDQSHLLGPTPVILSLTLGAAGVYFWKPNSRGKLQQRGRTSRVRDDLASEQGLFGCAPVLPGDLHLCNGRCQQELKTRYLV